MNGIQNIEAFKQLSKFSAKHIVHVVTCLGLLVGYI